MNVVLDKGEVTQLYGIDSGTTVTGEYPVQVQFIAGEGPILEMASEFRGYTMVPTTLWDDEYYSPVSSGTGAATYYTDLYIYNPTSAIDSDLGGLLGQWKFHCAPEQRLPIRIRQAPIIMFRQFRGTVDWQLATSG